MSSEEQLKDGEVYDAVTEQHPVERSGRAGPTRPWEWARKKRALERLLEGFGYTRTGWVVRYGGYGLAVGAVLAVSVALAILYSVVGPEGMPQAVVTATIGLIALFAGFYQWQRARSEITLDKFYERLAATNDKRVEWWSTRRERAANCTDVMDIDHETQMYIHLELNNLEYAIAKYRIGWMSDDNAYSTLRTFGQRCLHEVFRKVARELVENNIGYHPMTRNVVAEVCKWADGPSEWYGCNGLTQCIQKVDPDLATERQEGLLKRAREAANKD